MRYDAIVRWQNIWQLELVLLLLLQINDDVSEFVR